MEDVKDFILDYIQKEYTIPEDVDVLNLNYIASGHIDSLALIQFIAVMEDEFNIEFTDEDLENPDIAIVGRLIEMVSEKIGQ